MKIIDVDARFAIEFILWVWMICTDKHKQNNVKGPMAQRILWP